MKITKTIKSNITSKTWLILLIFVVIYCIALPVTTPYFFQFGKEIGLILTMGILIAVSILLLFITPRLEFVDDNEKKTEQIPSIEREHVGTETKE
jgi:hypothetical protein